MKIDWKHLAKTEGYKSLKTAFIKQNKSDSLRNKQEYYQRFQWVINRAKHYAIKMGVTLESVLNNWEHNRDYGVLNYYQNSRQPKIRVHKVLKPMGVKGFRKSCKKTWFHSDPQEIKHRVYEFIQRTQIKSKKKRWSMDYKRSPYRR